MGEEVAEYNGAYKASKGMPSLEKKSNWYPIAELGFTGIAVGSMNGCRPIVEYMTFILFGGYWSNYKQCSQNASNDRWTV
jgi:pyruvate/2-oxoglutarate/acetoin dehydrogenase E1 component